MKKEILKRVKALEAKLVGRGCGPDPMNDLFALISETNGIKVNAQNYVALIWGD